ncbi:hypothetical protein [Mangrovibacillus cuniculi]|uniref:Sporulation protein YjcZ n=1 Tax=Mangrovibacillus cuniculi TaxID=2593652 RepID=A0A7S8CBX3_9BACI|nr:hypothetical protein [Mangrovibacillus cuniculi]QPC46963.1 hypothetical protein G8O30_08305 [Mangrovibacillus cuniculi]
MQTVYPGYGCYPVYYGTPGCGVGFGGYFALIIVLLVLLFLFGGFGYYCYH